MDPVGDRPGNRGRGAGVQFHLDVRWRVYCLDPVAQAPAIDAKYTIPVSSGLIAGESLMGVAIIFAREALGIVNMLHDTHTPS